MTDGNASRSNKGKVSWIWEGREEVSSKPLGPARGVSAGVSNRQRSKQPIKAEFVNVILGDLEEFGFYFHLRRLDADGSVHQRVDQINGVWRITNNEFTARRHVLCEGARRESDPLGLQVFKGVCPAADTGLENFVALRTRCRDFSARDRASGDKARRHPILFRYQVGGVFGDRNDRDGIRLDLVFKPGEFCQVAQALRSAAHWSGKASPAYRQSLPAEPLDPRRGARSNLAGLGLI